MSKLLIFMDDLVSVGGRNPMALPDNTKH